MKTLDSWKDNARSWIEVIDNQLIKSRLTTNDAILNTLKNYKPKRLCDIACGEGWLTRACNAAHIPTVGIDGTTALIEHANSQGNGQFYELTYQQIIEQTPLPQSPYEAVVFNFCLYGKEETADLLQAVAQQLIDRKLIFIQTLHPVAFIQNDFAYKDQWIADSWAGLPPKFINPHQWYFRTLESWLALFNDLQLRLIALKEPIAKDSEKPASIIFVLRVE